MQVEDLDGNVPRTGSDPEKREQCGGMRAESAGNIWATKSMGASVES
jgi:hypothetical protein